MENTVILFGWSSEGWAAIIFVRYGNGVMVVVVDVLSRLVMVVREVL